MIYEDGDKIKRRDVVVGVLDCMDEFNILGHEWVIYGQSCNIMPSTIFSLSDKRIRCLIFRIRGFSMII